MKNFLKNFAKEHSQYLISEWANLIDFSPRKISKKHIALTIVVNNYSGQSDLEKMTKDWENIGHDIQASIDNFSTGKKTVSNDRKNSRNTISAY